MRYRLVALFVLIGLSAAACTDGSSGPSDTPSPSQSSVVTSIHSTPTTSAPVKTSSTPVVPTTGPNVRPGEKPPKLLGLAKKNNPLGSDEYTRFWIMSLDWAYATTSSTLARGLYASSCTGCARFLRNIIDDTRNHGQHFRGGRLAISKSEIEPNDHHFGSDQVVDVTIMQSALKVINSKGRVVETAPAVRTGIFRTWLKWIGTHWIIVDWKREIVR